MKITIKLFARFREIAGAGQLTENIADGATIADLIQLLKEKFTHMPLVAPTTILSVNQEFATPDTVLEEGDEVAIFPPVSGGSETNTFDTDKFALTYDPISMDQIIKMVTQPHTGAVVTFTGVIRNISDDKNVTSLEYEAYHDMAITKMKQVAAEAREQWPQIVDLAIVQRIGRLEVGEVAVAIAVSSGHRDQGCFEACQYSINRLKQIVPIWKKEFGPDGAEWVEGDFNPSLTNR